MTRLLALVLLCGGLFTARQSACNHPSPAPSLLSAGATPEDEDNDDPTPERRLNHGTDSRVSPCDDFWRYACGRYLDDVIATGDVGNHTTTIDEFRRQGAKDQAVVVEAIEKLTVYGEVRDYKVNLAVTLHNGLKLCMESAGSYDKWRHRETARLTKYLLQDLHLEKWLQAADTVTWSEFSREKLLNPFLTSLDIRRDFVYPWSPLHIDMSPNGTMGVYVLPVSADQMINLRRTMGHLHQMLFDEKAHSIKTSQTSVKHRHLFRKAYTFFNEYVAILERNMKTSAEVTVINDTSCESDLNVEILAGVKQHLRSIETNSGLKWTPPEIHIFNRQAVNETLQLWQSAHGEGMYYVMLAELAIYVDEWHIKQFHNFKDSHPHRSRGQRRRHMSGHSHLRKGPFGHQPAPTLDTVDRKWTCLETAQVFSTPVYLYVNMLATLRYESHAVLRETLVAVKRITELTREELRGQVLRSSWLHPATGDLNALVKRVNDTISNISIVLGFDERLLDEALMEKVFAQAQLGSYPITDDSGYIDYLIYLGRLGYRLRLDMVAGKTTQIDNQAAIQLSANAEARIYFDGQAPTIVMGTAFLRPPHFYADDPMHPVNLGQLAYVFAHELAHIVHFTVMIWNDERAMANQSSQLPAGFDRDRQCLTELYNDVCRVFDGQKVCTGGVNDFSENLADTVGIRVSHAVFVKHSSNTTRDSINAAAGGRYSPAQQFFLSTAKTGCNRLDRSAEIDIMIEERNTHSSSYARTNGRAMNSAAFAAAFRCDVGAPMNPARKCNVFEREGANWSQQGLLAEIAARLGL